MKQIKEEIEVISKTTLNPKVVSAMKNLQALYNDDANMIVKQAAQEKATKESSNFLIDLATITMVVEDTMPMENEPQMCYNA